MKEKNQILFKNFDLGQVLSHPDFYFLSHEKTKGDPGMGIQKNQFARWRFICRRVASGSYPNCGKLAKEYEVSRKTIQRDMTYLKEELDLPLSYCPVKKGYYFHAPPQDPFLKDPDGETEKK